MEITSQLTTITLTTVTGTTIGRSYSISIDNVRYDFVTTVATSVANAAAHIGNGLVDAINAGTNTLRQFSPQERFKLRFDQLVNPVNRLQ